MDFRRRLSIKPGPPDDWNRGHYPRAPRNNVFFFRGLLCQNFDLACPGYSSTIDYCTSNRATVSISPSCSKTSHPVKVQEKSLSFQLFVPVQQIDITAWSDHVSRGYIGWKEKFPKNIHLGWLLKLPSRNDWIEQVYVWAWNMGETR